MNTAIKVEKLDKKYGSKKILNNVNFSVKNAEIFGFLGPNGAGKTTTIRCILDFIRPDHGSVQVFGKNFTNNYLELRNLIGYVPSDNQLFLDWTGQNHIDFVNKFKVTDSQKLQALIKKLDYDPKLKIRELSSGNLQKLSFILALMGQPKLLILDEPTRGLDPYIQNVFYEELENFQKSGGTVFLSSHNLNEVQRICSKVAIIKNGTVIVSESIKDLEDMKVHIFDITFKNKIENLKLPNIEILNSSSDRLNFKASGDITRILSELAKYDISDIEISHASLEDIFLKYYRN